MSALDLTLNKFSLVNARELALFARMAYDEPPTVQGEGTDTQVLIRDCADYIVVAFRGTSSLRDFITDGNCFRRPFGFGDGSCHMGFVSAYQSVWGDVSRWLSANRAIIGKRPIIFTGHSLGGALAILSARRARSEFFNVHSVYVFGCPRVGDKTFQGVYNRTPMPGSPFNTLGEATFTVIHDCDIVPRVPGWLAGYRRPGRDEFISALSATTIVEDPSLLYRLESDAWSMLNAWRARRNPTFLDQLLTDHHINNYIAALAKIEPAPAPLPPLS